MKTVVTVSVLRTMLALMLVLCGPQVCAAAGAEEPGKATLVTDYRIGPGDVLSILVWNQENMDRTVTVRPDGRISVPLAGEFLVAGMTPQDLQQEIYRRLQAYINIQADEVTILVDEVHSYQVSVLGEVNEPGRFEFQNRTTVLDALAEAGGLTEFAQQSDILILRPVQAGTDRIRFNYRNATRSDDKGGNHLVLPGDIILVP